MTPEIEEVFTPLRKDIILLHARWLIHEQLFVRSEKRSEILNTSAQVFFQVVHETFVADTLISLSKLTDPATRRNYDNLTLNMLQSRVEIYCGACLKAKTLSILEKILKECEPFRTLRNKRLVHSDLAAALNPGVAPLPGVSREMVNETLRLVRDFMNAIECYYIESETAYDNVAAYGDGNSLVHVLKMGLTYRQLLRDKIIPYSDFHKSEWHDDH